MTDRLRPATDRVRSIAGSGRVVETIVTALVAVGCLWFVLAFLTIAAARLSYPLPLEWMEGGMVLETRRVLAGDALYVEPTLEFAPFIYPPLYFYVTAAVASVTGLGYVPLRLVAIASTLGCFAVIFSLVRREIGTLLPALAAVGLFAALYPAAGTWFDLARVDMLYLLVALAVVSIVRFGRGVRVGVFAGVVFVLAFLTKQSALLALSPLVIYSLYYKRRFGVTFAATGFGLVGASLLLLQVTSDGWFLYYVFELPTMHPTKGRRLLTFWTRDLLRPLALAAAVAVGYVLSAIGRGRTEIGVFYGLLLVGFVGSSWQARLHTGGAENTLIPAYAALAIGFGLGVAGALRAASEYGDRSPDCSPTIGRSVVLIAVLLQFTALLYVPGAHVPTSDEFDRAERSIEAVESMREPVFSPVYPYMAVAAGHEPTAHKMALVDVLRAEPHPERRALRGRLSRTLTRNPRYRTLLTHGGVYAFGRMARAAYRYDRPFPRGARPPRPVTGARPHPRNVIVPKRPIAAGNETATANASTAVVAVNASTTATSGFGSAVRSPTECSDQSPPPASASRRSVPVRVPFAITTSPARSSVSGPGEITHSFRARFVALVSRSPADDGSPGSASARRTATTRVPVSVLILRSPIVTPSRSLPGATTDRTSTSSDSRTALAITGCVPIPRSTPSLISTAASEMTSVLRPRWTSPRRVTGSSTRLAARSVQASNRDWSASTSTSSSTTSRARASLSNNTAP